MRTAIKRIKAGLLRIDVLGRVPDEEQPRRRRGKRENPTSPAQQFYNEKCSWRELELTIAANFAHGDYVVTFTYDDEHLPADKRAGDRSFQKFVRKLRTSRKKQEAELFYVYTTEGWHGRTADPRFGPDGSLEDRRIHHHAVLNGAGLDALEEMQSLWHGGGYVRVEPLDVHYYEELAKYLTKEAREFGRAKAGERAWKGSRNLKKYQVEYIEIPMGGVTLAPPEGAVDYRQFHERNPYGYADCIGARYLLYPSPPRQERTYNQMRRRS